MDELEKPFSSQWYSAPASRKLARRVGVRARLRCVELFLRRPILRLLPMVALTILVIASSWIVYPRTILPVSEEVMSRGDLTLETIPTQQPARSSISTGSIGVGEGREHGPLASSSLSAPAPALGIAEPTATEPSEGSLLPEHRILLVYGLPGNEQYGMLASYDNLRLLEILREKADEFEEYEPDRPIILGMQLITSAAQKQPGHDGSYLSDTSVSTVYQYIEFTREHDMVLFLDAQIGRRSVPEDVQRLDRYLQQPHVHLAIDPEFDVGRTEIPTQNIGSTRAADIRWVQEYLVNLSAAAGIPPKILIVHQFTDEMIQNRPLLRPVRGVQMVMSVGLWGSIEQKSSAYNSLVADDLVEFGGIMISGAWDNPAMSTEDVINLPHAPEIVIYQ